MAALGVTPYEALTDATVMLDELWEMDAITQMARFGETVQHITRQKQWAGGALKIKLMNEQFSRAIASSDLEADAPLAGRIRTMDLTVEESDLRKVAFGLRYTLPAQEEVDGSEDAVFDLASELLVQALQSIDEKRNHMIWQNSDGVKALVKATYDPDGTTFSTQTLTYLGTGSVAGAFITIDGGSISKFHPGERIDIRNASTTAVRIRAIITDVYHGLDYLGQGIGPGILCAIDAVGDSAEENFSTVVDNDEIFSSGEVDGSGLDVGFAQFFNRTTPGAYFDVTDRAGPGFQFLIPYGRDYDNVPIDTDVHFGHMADLMGMLFGPARANRRARAKQFKMTDAIVCLAQPDLVNAVARQAGSPNLQFTSQAASSMEEAKRKNLVSVQGWQGSVLHHPTLPPIALQSEPLAAENTITIIEPSTWRYIRMGSKKPRFITNDSGGIWHTRRNVTTGQLTVHKDASGYVVETLLNDQPQLNYRIDGVTTDVDA